MNTPDGFIIGIDYGTKRIGLAVGDAVRRIASPLATVPSAGDPVKDAEQVLARSREFDVAEFVVGLPLNMNGSEGPQAECTRRFGSELERLAGRPVHYFDERLSSFAADELLREAETTARFRKSRVDQAAAQLILQEFLNERETTP
jgi:putative Holliday junction resolvase